MRCSVSTFATVITATILVLTSFRLSFAGEPKFTLGGGTHFIHGGSCEPGNRNVLAGSAFLLAVDNTADQPRRVREDEWPLGYELEAALDMRPDIPFAATPGLILRLQPDSYLGIVNRAVNNELRRNPQSPYIKKEDIRQLNRKHFVLHIPDDIAGHDLSFRVRYKGNGVELQSNTFGPCHIIPVCNADDTARIYAMEIDVAQDRGDDARAVAIADSMLSRGLTNAVAWDIAGVAAWSLGEHNKELVFFDKLFQDFGAIGLDETGEPMTVSRDPGIRQAYESQRANILQAIAQQQQR